MTPTLLGRLLRAVRRYAGQDAEDLVHDALLALLLGGGPQAADPRFTPWLLTVARRLFVDRKRTEACHRRLEAEVPRPQEPGVLDDQAREAVRGLPEAFRRTFELRCLEGFSSREVADMLGVSHLTVNTRVHRARQILRQEAI